MKKSMFLVMLISLLSLLNAASVYTLKDGKGDEGFESCFKGDKIHARVDKENLINKDEDNVNGYLYYNYFNKGINIHLDDINFYKDFDSGNINFWFEAYSYDQKKKQDHDRKVGNRYILGNPHKYTKLVIFPVSLEVKETDSWNTLKSVSKRIKKMKQLNNIIINRSDYGTKWIDGILPDENIYYSINTYLPKDKMTTIEILLIKSDNIFNLLSYLNIECRSELLSTLDVPDNSQIKYIQETKQLFNTINQMKQDEFETSEEFQERLQKAHEKRYQGDKILSENLEKWVEADRQKIEASEERIQISDFSFGYYNADEMKLPIIIVGLKGYISVSPTDAKTLKTKSDNINVTAIRKMNLDMDSYSYSDIIIEHPDLDKEFEFEQ